MPICEHCADCKFSAPNCKFISEIEEGPSLVLRQAGFTVDEAYNLNSALGLLMSDSIDAVLLCHTIPKDKQRSFISAAHRERRLLPIICIKAQDHEGQQQDCVSVGSDPDELLEASKIGCCPHAHQRAIPREPRSSVVGDPERLSRHFAGSVNWL